MNSHIIQQGRSRRLYKVTAFLLGFCMLFAACKEDEIDSNKEQVITVLFYLGGDNNLSPEILLTEEQLHVVAPPSFTRVLVYKDTKDSKPQLIEIIQDGKSVKTKTVKEYEECNSASPEVLKSVLQGVREQYPASSYGLVVSSHASGWLPSGTYSNPTVRSSSRLRSVIIDNNSEMELADFAAAIPDNMFDFIVFETCYMAGIEVAWELKDKTQYIVASSAEIVSPGFVPCYKKALSQLYLGDLPGFCRIVEEDYLSRSGDYASLTLSIIDTYHLESLSKVLQGVGCPVYSNNIQTFDRYGKQLFFDFRDSFTSILSKEQLESLQDVLDRSIVWKTSTPTFMPNYGGFNINSHCGLTTYIPQGRYPKLDEAYMKLKWYKLLSYGR